MSSVAAGGHHSAVIACKQKDITHTPIPNRDYDDYLIGGLESDYISTYGGNDVVFALDGDDIIAIKITDNRPNEDGYRYSAMRDEILELTETWTLGSENERLNYKAEYLMNDGEFVLWEGLRQWFKDAA